MVYLYTCFSEAPLSFKTLLSLPKSRMIKKSVVMCRCFRSFCLFSVVYLSAFFGHHVPVSLQICVTARKQKAKTEKRRKKNEEDDFVEVVAQHRHAPRGWATHQGFLRLRSKRFPPTSASAFDWRCHLTRREIIAEVKKWYGKRWIKGGLNSLLLIVVLCCVVCVYVCEMGEGWSVQSWIILSDSSVSMTPLGTGPKVSTKSER